MISWFEFIVFRRDIVVGSALFGIGWAIAGTCPGPAVVQVGQGHLSGLFTLAASVIWGVNTLFLLDAGLDIFQVFVVNAAYTAGMVLFEIPTGRLGDRYGSRRVLTRIVIWWSLFTALTGACSGLLTLIVVPVVYTLVDDFALWLKRKWTGAKAH